MLEFRFHVSFNLNCHIICTFLLPAAAHIYFNAKLTDYPRVNSPEIMVLPNVRAFNNNSKLTGSFSFVIILTLNILAVSSPLIANNYYFFFMDNNFCSGGLLDDSVRIMWLLFSDLTHVYSALSFFTQ